MSIHPAQTIVKKYLPVGLHLIVLWPAVLWLGWLALSQFNFLYPMDYRLLNIPATIEKYVPQNRHGKQNFIETNANEHARLFSAITKAINNEGQGLSELRYFSPDGRYLGVFLTHDEVTHLTDVSHVVDIGKDAGKLAFLVWLIIVGITLWRKKPLPSLRSFAIGTALSLFIAGIIVFAIGPMRVFDDFHRSVFPANHPWFFYYQDSLMTTFMQAPNLFGLIVLWWVIAASVLLLILWSLARFLASIRANYPKKGK